MLPLEDLEAVRDEGTEDIAIYLYKSSLDIALPEMTTAPIYSRKSVVRHFSAVEMSQ